MAQARRGDEARSGPGVSEDLRLALGHLAVFQVMDQQGRAADTKR